MMTVPAPCWVICTPRSGSTFLCELLNHTGVFPSFMHAKLHQCRGPLERDRAFDEWLRAYDSMNEFIRQPPRHLKAIGHQLFSLLPDITHETIADMLPQIQYVRLRRNDPVKQAVSEYIAKTAKMYHLYSDWMQTAFVESNVPIKPAQLVLMYRAIQQAEAQLDQLLATAGRVVPVYYELIDQSPAEQLLQIMQQLGQPITQQVAEDAAAAAQQRLIRMTHPAAADCEAALREELARNVAQ